MGCFEALTQDAMRFPTALFPFPPFPPCHIVRNVFQESLQQMWLDDLMDQ